MIQLVFVVKMTARKPIAMANILPTEDEVPQCRKRLLECETLESILLPNGIVNETSPASSYYSAGDISIEIDSRMSDPLHEDSPATNHENTKETKFHKDSLVFAKLSGHSDPPWPARVAKVCWTNGTHCGYEVFFYGTYQVGIVSKDKIWGYNEDFIAKFSKPKMSAKRKLDFSKGLVEIRDCPDIAPSRDVPESASQIAKKLIRRTAIKDDQKIKGKAMTGIKKSKNKESSWVLAKSNKRLVYDESTDEDCDEGHPIKKKRTLSMNDDSLSSASESKNNNRRSNRNRKVPYWRRVDDDGSQVDPYSIDQLDEYVKPSASSESLAQNTRKSSSNGKQNKIKVCKNFEDDKKVSKGSDKSISKRRSSVYENNDSTESEEALQNSNPPVNVTRFNPKKRILKADCVIVKEEPLSEDPNEWTVAQTVASIVRMDPTITPEDIKGIREQNIDGCALLKLDFHEFVTYCQVKVGPAIKLSCLVKELKVKVSTVSNGSTML